jgi:hypothetical protein
MEISQTRSVWLISGCPCGTKFVLRTANNKDAAPMALKTAGQKIKNA